MKILSPYWIFSVDETQRKQGFSKRLNEFETAGDLEEKSTVPLNFLRFEKARPAMCRMAI
jgi:hypothetical protein